MKQKQIILQVQNNMSIQAPISLFGGMFDPNGNTVNTHNRWAWDISAQTYVGLSLFQLQYRRVGVIPYTTISMPVPGNFADVIRILNLQGLGTFWAVSLILPPLMIYTMSDTLQFNQLSIA